MLFNSYTSCYKFFYTTTNSILIDSYERLARKKNFLDNVEKLIELSVYNHTLKRNAKVEDITPIIQMLISKESDYINGINIPITGGSIF